MPSTNQLRVVAPWALRVSRSTRPVVEEATAGAVVEVRPVLVHDEGQVRPSSVLRLKLIPSPVVRMNAYMSEPVRTAETPTLAMLRPAVEVGGVAVGVILPMTSCPSLFEVVK